MTLTFNKKISFTVRHHSKKYITEIPLKEGDKIKEKPFVVGKIRIVHSEEFHDDDNNIV